MKTVKGWVVLGLLAALAGCTVQPTQCGVPARLKPALRYSSPLSDYPWKLADASDDKSMVEKYSLQ